MANPLLMPKLGLTMVEGLLAEWLVEVGAPFKTGDGLFVVETDKVATEISADADGVLVDIAVPAGAMAAIGVAVGHWSADGVPDDASHSAPPSAPPPAAGAPFAGAREADHGDQRLLSTPLARRVAAQRGVELQHLAGSGSGPRGRIKAADVVAFADRTAPLHIETDSATSEGAQSRERTTHAAQPAVAKPSLGSVAGANTMRVDRGVRSKPSTIQAAMARRLTEVKQSVPHFYLAVEVNVAALLGLRHDLNRIQEAPRLTLNDFVLAAVGRSLCDLPRSNRVWSDGEIVSFESSDVGVAVSTTRGLFVPVLRNLGRLSLNELARHAHLKIDAARAGTLGLDDSAGGAVTVSNAGMYNVKFMTPIINPGQAMILGVGSTGQVFRPDSAGLPTLHHEMGMVLAGDHRILDGVAGLTFLNRVVSYLEQPLKLLAGS